MKRHLFGALAFTALIFTGCGDPQPSLSDAIDNSFEVKKGMQKDEVKTLLLVEPTNKQRIDDEEIWKFEGNIYHEEKEISRYNNLIIKFKNDKVTNVGVFSCNLPKTED